MLRVLVSACVVAVLACPQVFSDQIILTNGDRLTGKIVEADGDTMTFNSGLIGEIEMAWSAIEKLTSDKPVYIILNNGQLLTGTISVKSGKFDINNESAQKAALTKEGFRTLRGEEAWLAYTREVQRRRQPGFFDFWNGSVDTGLSLTRGNSSTTTLDIGATAVRVTPRDTLRLYLTSLFAEEGTTRGVTVTTARSLMSGWRYDYNLPKNLFVFGFGELQSDRFQLLDLRSVLGGGLGWHALKTEDTLLDVYGGADFDQELFSDRVQRRVGPVTGPPTTTRRRRPEEFFSTHLTRRSGELLLGEDFSHRLAQNVSLTERLMVFPNLTDQGEFRIGFDAALVTKINRWLDWQVSFRDHYLSNPVPGIKKNDVLMTAGIRLTFGNEDEAGYAGMRIPSPNTGLSPDRTRPETSPSAPRKTPVKKAGKR